MPKKGIITRKDMQPKTMRMSVLGQKIVENRSKLKEVMVKLLLIEAKQENLYTVIGKIVELYPELEDTVKKEISKLEDVLKKESENV